GCPGRRDDGRWRACRPRQPAGEHAVVATGWWRGMAEGTGTKPMVIVGGGKTGGTAAATLREEGFDGPVVIISREPGIPFGRPPLTKEYLRSEQGLEDWYVRPADWYEAHELDLCADSVAAVDSAAHTLALASG